jgi:hypothetical protein
MQIFHSLYKTIEIYLFFDWNFTYRSSNVAPFLQFEIIRRDQFIHVSPNGVIIYAMNSSPRRQCDYNKILPNQLNEAYLGNSFATVGQVKFENSDWYGN